MYKKFFEWDPKAFEKAKQQKILDTAEINTIPDWVPKQMELLKKEYGLDTKAVEMVKNAIPFDNARIVVYKNDYYSSNSVKYYSTHSTMILKLIYKGIITGLSEEDFWGWHSPKYKNFNNLPILCLHYNGSSLFFAESYEKGHPTNINQFLVIINKICKEYNVNFDQEL